MCYHEDLTISLKFNCTSFLPTIRIPFIPKRLLCIRFHELYIFLNLLPKANIESFLFLLPLMDEHSGWLNSNVQIHVFLRIWTKDVTDPQLTNSRTSDFKKSLDSKCLEFEFWVPCECVGPHGPSDWWQQKTWWEGRFLVPESEIEELRGEKLKILRGEEAAQGWEWWRQLWKSQGINCLSVLLNSSNSIAFAYINGSKGLQQTTD